MCRTRIEKNEGCNHMTCGFCEYEFCWVCGASATNEDNHFGVLRGCGVDIMDDTKRPGDHLKFDHQKTTRRNRCKYRAAFVGKVILCIIFYPLIVVFVWPLLMARDSLENSIDKIWWERVIRAIGAFFLGIVMDICVIPILLALTVALIVFIIFRVLTYFLCC